jgi:pyrimidine deaminase RibD-like protein
MLKLESTGIKMLSRKDVSYLNLARSLAEKSEENKKHGAVVIKSGRVVGYGFNKFKNHTDLIPEDLIKVHCSRHAEEVAIKTAGQNAKGATLYVARVNKQGLDRNSKPCKICTDLIEESGIKKVIYTMEGSL